MDTSALDIPFLAFRLMEAGYCCTLARSGTVELLVFSLRSNIGLDNVRPYLSEHLTVNTVVIPGFGHSVVKISRRTE